MTIFLQTNRRSKADFASTMELLARFPQGTKPLRGCRELATSSLPTALECKSHCVSVHLSCFLQEKVRVSHFPAPLLPPQLFTSWVKLWVRNLWAFLQTTESAARHYQKLLWIVASGERKVKP